MMRYSLLLTVLVSAMIAPVSSALAREEILLFRSYIVVNPDSTLTVTETVTVRAEGKQIKRGIHRDFPTRKASIWYNKRYGFEVLSVKRDGRNEPHHFDRQPNYTRVYFGRKNVMLKHGVYTYTFKYKTTRQIRYFKDHDELYWNVNGTKWAFPTRKVEAVVKLPGSTGPSGPLEAYTGRRGMKGKDYRCGPVSANDPRYCFATTRGFQAGENLTIVVPFAKGLLAEPAPAEKWAIFLDDNKALGGMVIGILILLGYYVVAWYRVGRDPKGEVIIPRFTPPEDVSPAGAGFLHKMTFGAKCVIAAIVSLAVKSHLRIVEADHGYTLEKWSGDSSPGRPRPEEKDALRKLFSGKRKALELKQENHKKLRAIRKAVKKSLETEYRKFFLNNTPWFVIGLVLTGLILAGSVLLDAKPEIIFLFVWLSAWTVGVVTLLKGVIFLWRSVRIKKGLHRIGGIFGSVFFTLFALPFVVGEVVAICFLALLGTVWMVLIAIVMGLINLKFWFWLKQPTVEGRKLMDEIQGFKMYLATAEGDLMERTAPMKTLELFEDYLPYAIALGVEKQWAEHFEHLFDMNMQGGGMHTAWYTGSGLAAGGAGAFVSSLSGGFAGAMSSASSSGGGGGGSSGGGGGGGGGGGW